MPIHDEYSDALQNLEAAVVAIFRHPREMTDNVALRPYEAAYERYRAEHRAHPPKPHSLAGLDATTAGEAVCAIGEGRLGRDPGPESKGSPSIRFRREKWSCVGGG